MKEDIKLYIADQLVDLSDDISIPYTYQLEDLENPTAIKNSYTKSITIPGTANNNNIFGQIYKLDRNQINNGTNIIGSNFNPSKRVPFSLFKNAELIESGYMQLNTISLKNNIISYSITLYGGLGDFFYNLMYDDETGEKLTLADLQYFVEDSDGNILPKDSEMDFRIKKEAIIESWNKINNVGNTLFNYITFLPGNNGLYENFDNNKVLINTFNSNVFTETAITENNVVYTTYNGYALGELNDEFTEWEMRDLRSYMQRPAIKMSKLIEAICKPENNGGYEVSLDQEFFNEENPYFTKTYIALPLFNTLNENDNNDENVESNFLKDLTYQNYYVGSDLVTYHSSITTPLAIDSSAEVLYESGIIDYSSLPYSTTIDIDFIYSFDFIQKKGEISSNYFLGYKFGSSPSTASSYRGYFEFYLIITDENDTILYQTKTNRFTDKGSESNTSQSADNFLGRFTRNGNDPIYFRLYDNDLYNFNISLKNIYSPSQKLKVKIYMNWPYQTGSLGQMKLLSNADMENRPYGYINIDFSGSKINFKYGNSIISNSLITKNKLLKTENSPADYLIDYCKIFGLVFEKDLSRKSIKIMSKNRYFKNEIIDLSNLIDYSQELKIEPQVFSNKFYRMKYEDTDNYYSTKYKSEYNIEYGQQRLNTNYNFNNNTTDLLEDNVYQNSITVQDKSSYFYNFYNKNGNNVPAFLLDNISYKLFNGVGTDDEKEYSKDLYYYDFVDVTKSVGFSKIPGYDFMYKNCFYNLDNNKQNLSDISSTLLFFNDFVQLSDAVGKPIKYWISDDVGEMNVLNDNTPCYIYSEGELDKNGNKIAIQLTEIPQFTRYIFSQNTVTKSLDFGKPLEIYINNINYNDNITLYNLFWKNLLEDQFDVMTKKITCYVNFNAQIVNEECLKRIYYFENSYWLLNKIYEYDVNKYSTTKCEFIKINNIQNYTNGQITQGRYIIMTPNDVTVDFAAGNLSILVESNDNWKKLSTSPEVSISPESGNMGNTDILVEYQENNTFNYRILYVTLVFEDGTGKFNRLNIKQLPNPQNVIKISGKVLYNDGTKIPDGRIRTYNGNFNNIVYVGENGEYEIYAQKNNKFTYQVLGSSSSVLYEINYDAQNSNFVKNITISK